MADAPLRMSHALILTRLSSHDHRAGITSELIGVTSEGQSLLVRSDEHQRVNVALLEHQRLPLVVLSDRLLPSTEADYELPAQALISPIPLPSAEVEALIRSGREQALLNQVREQLV
ncbi:hypothetical protein [Marinobacterium stanieri]|uniref:hypothetical protein n=1 Tax=Marinobacterium stanieri TaxID=49186 RepID=UPI000255A622|nr:hypothetical protein [Marinobacterium stanieri]